MPPSLRYQRRARPLLLAPLCLAAMFAAAAPEPADATSTAAAMPVNDSPLSRGILPLTQAHPAESGVLALIEGRDAFAARALLARSAQRSLDVQYYIWRDDRAGMLLLQGLWQAAERGVKVRLLLDDNNTGGLDGLLAALDAHPNIELRLYNPLYQRRLRWLNYLTDFSRLNRRMHNKSFSADGLITIVGGRNVGNEYFDLDSEVLFADLDVLTIGQAVGEVEQSFERYWNSASAVPATDLLPPADAESQAALQARFAAILADPASGDYAQALHDTEMASQMLSGSLALEWARARLVQDDPAKTLNPAPREQPQLLLLDDLARQLAAPRQALHLVSPYFVPGKRGTESLVRLAGQGVQVQVLTNSLAATDVAAVHAGYAKRREALLRGGVRLFELKPSARAAAAAAKAASSKRLLGSGSAASLHAKTFAIDGEQLFVGSFNFDPRSALLNTELGLLIASPPLAGRLVDFFAQELPLLAYEVRLDPQDGRLQWLERQADGGTVMHAEEPGSSWLRRLGVWLASWLPIEWLL